jgi:hypothetical protein
MTTSRYVSTFLFDRGNVVMSDYNWDKFKKSIFTGCTFEVDMTQNYYNQKEWPMCNFNSRYYQDPYKLRKYFHVTNDDRRKIKRFIITNYPNNE